MLFFGISSHSLPCTVHMPVSFLLGWLFRLGRTAFCNGRDFLIGQTGKGIKNGWENNQENGQQCWKRSTFMVVAETIGTLATGCRDTFGTKIGIVVTPFFGSMPRPCSAPICPFLPRQTNQPLVCLLSVVAIRVELLLPFYHPFCFILLDIRAHSRLLSALSSGLYEDGYTDIVNIDISDVIIQQMVEEHGGLYPLMTCTLPQKPHSFRRASSPHSRQNDGCHSYRI